MIVEKGLTFAEAQFAAATRMMAGAGIAGATNISEPCLPAKSEKKSPAACALSCLLCTQSGHLPVHRPMSAGDACDRYCPSRGQSRRLCTMRRSLIPILVVVCGFVALPLIIREFFPPQIASCRVGRP